MSLTNFDFHQKGLLKLILPR
jgi:zinc-binding in reverse transcriptase